MIQVARLIGLLVLIFSMPIPASFTQIYQFPEPTFIENIHVCQNGHLLLTTVSSGQLFTLDPTEENASPKSIAQLGNTTGLTGIAPIWKDIYAITGGEHGEFVFTNNSMHLYVVRVSEDGEMGEVMDDIHVPGTQMLNGMAALPTRPYVLLSADSIGARIFRINTHTGEVDVAFSDPLLGFGDNIGIPLGANGLKIRDGHMYFTNSAQGFFARVKINRDGDKAGDIEVIARLSKTPSQTYAYDDFTFDDRGNAYVALHSDWVVKITPDGKQTIIEGDPETKPFIEPTAAALSLDGESIYVATGGTDNLGGQVIQVQI